MKILNYREASMITAENWLVKHLFSEKSATVETCRQLGCRQIDTVMDTGGKHYIVTPAEGKTRLLLIGKLEDRTTASLNRRAINLEFER